MDGRLLVSRRYKSMFIEEDGVRTWFDVALALILLAVAVANVDAKDTPARVGEAHVIGTWAASPEQAVRTHRSTAAMCYSPLWESLEASAAGGGVGAYPTTVCAGKFIVDLDPAGSACYRNTDSFKHNSGGGEPNALPREIFLVKERN